MAPLTAGQRRWRARTERLIGLAEPGLDLVLAVGDRISRLVGGRAPSEPLAPPPAPDGPVRRAMTPRR